jgi:predicted transcriptional regulator of viral defense system
MNTVKKLAQVRNLLPPVFNIAEIATFFPEKAAPRKYCERLVKAGVLIRLKKGFYAFSEVDALVVANYLAPCSYVSYETALSYYGMIPEFTPLVMSVSSVSRHRVFSTTIGSYEYFHQSSELYAAGMDRVMLSEQLPLLIATPEKALCDTLDRRGERYHNKDVSFISGVLESLRLDDDALARLNRQHITDFADLYTSLGAKLLLQYLEAMTSHE